MACSHDQSQCRFVRLDHIIITITSIMIIIIFELALVVIMKEIVWVLDHEIVSAHFGSVMQFFPVM